MGTKTMSEPTRKIRMTRGHNGYEAGVELELEPGVADAFVHYAQAAVYIDVERETKSMDAPPADKLLRRDSAKVSRK